MFGVRLDPAESIVLKHGAARTGSEKLSTFEVCIKLIGN